MNLVVVGAQWGDEGKGKIIDILSPYFQLVVRYQGGENAGHTVVEGGRKIVLHTVPTGIVRGITSLIGGGTVVHPPTLFKEIEELRRAGIEVEAYLRISKTAHVVLPIHRQAERISEARRKDKKIGTTGKGIGPAYEDKFGRRGVRIGDLLYREVLEEKLSILFTEKYREEAPEPGLLEELLSWGRRLFPMMVDGAYFVNSYLKERKNILFEGAQGTLLDVDFGTYPYVTSSNSSAAGVSSGAGLSPRFVDHVLGIGKFYATRVGEGPFPTEIRGEIERRLREKGGEFGATTGRPRRCGWLDLVALKYSSMINGFSGLALMKLDVLDGLDNIKVAVKYRLNGREIESFPPDPYILEKVEVVYETLPGWGTSTRGIKEFSQLPRRALDYLKFIEDYLSVPIWFVSTGPSRDELIITPSGREFLEKFSR